MLCRGNLKTSLSLFVATPRLSAARPRPAGRRFQPMLSLATALSDLDTQSGRLTAVKAVTDAVLGPCPPGQEGSWEPGPYEEGKSR